MNTRDLGILDGMEKSAAKKGRRRGPWTRSLMSQGAAHGRLGRPGSFGQSGAKMRQVADVHGSSKTAAVIDPMKIQRALELTGAIVREMSPAMITGAITGAMVSRARADKNKGGEMVRGALLGSVIGGVIGTGTAISQQNRVMAQSANAEEAMKTLRNLQQMVGAGAGAAGAFLRDPKE